MSILAGVSLGAEAGGQVVSVTSLAPPPGRGYAASSTRAIPWPPPMHMVTTPYLLRARRRA